MYDVIEQFSIFVGKKYGLYSLINISKIKFNVVFINKREKKAKSAKDNTFL